MFQGTAAEVTADIRAYRALGVSHFVFDPPAPDVKAWFAIMDRFAHDVRPKVR
jgi:hypothetical protein